MTYTFLQLFSSQRILLPSGILGWLVWLAVLGLSFFLAWRSAGPWQMSTKKKWFQFLLVAISVPVSILIATFRLPPGESLPIPGLGSPAIGALIAPLAVLPWLFALVWFGPLPAIGLASFSGLFLALWDTRSSFTIVDLAFVMAIFSALLNQQYRTRLFAILRQPLAAALVAGLFYPLLFVATAFFWVSPSPISSLDFAISRIIGEYISVGAPLLLAGAALQVVHVRWPALTPAVEARQPAPSERSLEARFLFTLGPVVLLAFLALGVLAWWGTGNAAEQLFSDRVANNVDLAAKSVPFILENGQNLILQLSGNTRLADPNPAEAAALLNSHLSTVPYFDQLTLLDTGGNTIAGTPVQDYLSLQPTALELDAVSLAIQGVPLQILSAPSLDSQNNSGLLLFIAAVRNSNNQVRGVLVGRTALNTNPFAQPVVQSLESLTELGAQAFLIDADGRIVMAPTPGALLQPYNGQRGDSALSYESVSPDGERLLVQYQPVPGSNWGVVAAWPASLSQQLALQIALPILGVLILLALVGYGFFRASLRSVTGSLRDLAAETQLIASGELKAPMTVKGADEIGRLGEAFETMRQSLRSRVEETQRLLTLSKGLSSSLEVRSHIDPILDAALAGGATVARLVFAGQGNGSVIGFGKGKGNEKYETIDPQILLLTRGQSRVLLSNPARARLKFEKGTPVPESIAAFALRDQNDHLGAIWLAYDEPQSFLAETVRYLEALASQAASAVTNARHYVNARLAQQRLESVLMADPSALFITDAKQNIVFANDEAMRLFGIKQNINLTGLQNGQVVGLFSKAGSKPVAAEVQAEGRTLSALVSPIWSGSELLGFAATFKDVTHDRQAEATRTDFLGTIGHDLHDPLELMRGYLSMLSMVGELNTQQLEYVQKIERNIEGVSRLAVNLLATERLDGHGGLQLERFSFADLVNDVIQEIGPRLRQKKVEVVVEPGSPSIPAVEADRTLLQRAVYNLLDNAVKFSPRNEKVQVSLQFDAQTTTLRVRDAGAGIAPVDQPGLFRRGEKAGGLSIVRSIAERHGGRVWVESELGSGAAFYLQIPLKQPKK